MSLSKRLASTLRRMADDLYPPEPDFVPANLSVTQERWGPKVHYAKDIGCQLYFRRRDYPRAHRDALEPIPPGLRSDAARES